MSLRTSYLYATGQFDRAVQEIYAPISEAGTRAMRAAADDVKAAARANIASAGFSKRWQNALRVQAYPKRGASINAALLMFHKIPYADVFESGATLRGNPSMWVPLNSTPKKVNRKRMTPERFIDAVGPLFPLKSRSGTRLLAARMAVSNAKFNAGPPYKVTLGSLRTGAQGGATASGRRRSLVAVPLFAAASTVKIAKKINVTAVMERAADRLPALYFKHLEAD